MNVHAKIFPTAGICDKAREFDITLEQGGINEVLAQVQEQLGMNADLRSNKALMFLHNGRVLDQRRLTAGGNDLIFQDGDKLWLMPLLSGG